VNKEKLVITVPRISSQFQRFLLLLPMKSPSAPINTQILVTSWTSIVVVFAMAQMLVSIVTASLLQLSHFRRSEIASTIVASVSRQLTICTTSVPAASFPSQCLAAIVLNSQHQAILTQQDHLALSIVKKESTALRASATPSLVRANASAPLQKASGKLQVPALSSALFVLMVGVVSSATWTAPTLLVLVSAPSVVVLAVLGATLVKTALFVAKICVHWMEFLTPSLKLAAVIQDILVPLALVALSAADTVSFMESTKFTLEFSENVLALVNGAVRNATSADATMVARVINLEIVSVLQVGQEHIVKIALRLAYLAVDAQLHTTFLSTVTTSVELCSVMRPSWRMERMFPHLVVSAGTGHRILIALSTRLLVISLAKIVFQVETIKIRLTQASSNLDAARITILTGHWIMTALVEAIGMAEFAIPATEVLQISLVALLAANQMVFLSAVMEIPNLLESGQPSIVATLAVVLLMDSSAKVVTVF
jgi:hypothetical protein